MFITFVWDMMPIKVIEIELNIHILLPVSKCDLWRYTSLYWWVMPKTVYITWNKEEGKAHRTYKIMTTFQGPETAPRPYQGDIAALVSASATTYHLHERSRRVACAYTAQYRKTSYPRRCTPVGGEKPGCLMRPKVSWRHHYMIASGAAKLTGPFHHHGPYSL